MQSFFKILGVISDIQLFDDCSLVMTVNDRGGGMVHLIVDSTTYVVDMEDFSIGDEVLAYCDSNAPVPLIYPPRYRPALMLEPEEDVNYDLDTFGDRLINSQGTLRIQVTRQTEVILPNGQPFWGSLNGKMLLVEYKASTRSIPALTTPERVIVFCSSI